MGSLEWRIALVDSGAGCSLTALRLLAFLRDTGALLGVWRTAIPHEWGGLTAESVKDGHRIPGLYWCIFLVKVKTTSSST